MTRILGDLGQSSVFRWSLYAVLNLAIVWKERLRGKYSASPIYAENRIYLFNEDATTTVIRPDREFPCPKGWGRTP